MSDYIKLPRSALQQLPTAQLRGIYLSLLEKADGAETVTISVRGFADECGVSYQTMRTALSKLADNALINAAANANLTQRLTQITICDLDDNIISRRSRQRKLNAAPNAAPNATPIKRFTPPTDAEVAAYVAEKGYHFDPAAFVPFYQSKGWMVGSNPMKDWRASCRTWEIEWKKKHGTKFYYEIERQPARSALAGQNDRYSELERAAGAILRNAPYVNPASDD